MIESKPLIYLYDLPKSLVTSVRINDIIKKSCAGYELSEPVQFKEPRISTATGLPSPLVNGIIKVDQSKFNEVVDGIKYFEIADTQDDKKVWRCRALPYDKDLIGNQKNITNLKQNVFVKAIPSDWTAKNLEENFSKFGKVKSAKVSLAPVLKKENNEQGKKLIFVDENVPCQSLGYGFVCFENEEGAFNLIERQEGEFGEIKTFKFTIKDPKDFKRIFNNIYIKNFDATWDNAKIQEIFGKYGAIKSASVMADSQNAERKFAFVCFEDSNDVDAGFKAAEQAVQELNDAEYNGVKLYVQPALTALQRQGVILREQQRFKNSKKKCNLFVKNFPAEFGVEELRPHFANFGEIESIKILPTHDGQPSTRAFVCYKQPDIAAFARSRLHGSQINGRQLYVANYELPEIRKRQQAEAKDKADFYNQKKQFGSQQLELNILQRPDTIQLIQQILLLLQRQFNGRMPFNNFGGNRGQNNYNNGNNQQQQQQRLPRPAGVQGGNQGYNNRNQGQNRPQQNYQNVPLPVGVPQVAQQVVITTGMIGGPQTPLPSQDPVINAYNQKGFGYLPAVVPENPNYKAIVGEFIYEYVEKLVGDQRAPKITGMLIDLPIDEIKAYLYDFSKLYQKIGDAVNLLNQLQGQNQ